ncbi:MAG TPA: isoprenyl transferase [Tenuifilaceae bacterium]|nr:isoprenyl transferase [Tenuifilaceae bacterium]HPW25658.1 isoprenyl transferase [Tenuifilaceae bacterium]HQM04508.1 isoprenyl transferase [Tenuifilaceae bacterium]
MDIKNQIDKNNVPQHVAIIMDGNGRWAEKRGLPRIFGHKNGVGAVRAATEAAGEIGVKFLTLYAFSTENWKRPKIEIDTLMNLLIETIDNEIGNLNKNDVRLITIGNTSALPKNVQTKLKYAIDKTSQGKTLTTILALNYGARAEITEATRKILIEYRNGKLDEMSLSPEVFGGYLQTAGIPDPELLIRTSGEIRLSNFLLWQLAYAELYFTPVLWPDFSKDDFFNAIVEYQHRERRFGMTSEQL